MNGLFRDRREAGRALAEGLSGYSGCPGGLVLALPRGGVPVAFEVAWALELPLDIFLVRKLGVPGHEELAFGAIASGGVRVLNEHVVRRLKIDPAVIEATTAEEEAELHRRERAYRGDVATSVRDRTVLLVDDGLATGASMRVAVTALRRRDPARIVVAVPIGPSETCDEFRDLADDVICARTPDPFRAVGLAYEDFSQTSDEEVRELLLLAAQREVAAGRR